jgi:hypothetical protein
VKLLNVSFFISKIMTCKNFVLDNHIRTELGYFSPKFHEIVCQVRKKTSHTERIIGISDFNIRLNHLINSYKISVSVFDSCSPQYCFSNSFSASVIQQVINFSGLGAIRYPYSWYSCNWRIELKPLLTLN